MCHTPARAAVASWPYATGAARPALHLGQTVLYTTGGGHDHVAQVIGLPENISDDGAENLLGPDGVVLFVMSPSGKSYVRTQVLAIDQVRPYTEADFTDREESRFVADYSDAMSGTYQTVTVTAAEQLTQTLQRTSQKVTGVYRTL